MTDRSLKMNRHSVVQEARIVELYFWSNYSVITVQRQCINIAGIGRSPSQKYIKSQVLKFREGRNRRTIADQQCCGSPLTAQTVALIQLACECLANKGQLRDMVFHN